MRRDVKTVIEGGESKYKVKLIYDKLMIKRYIGGRDNA